MQYIKPHYLLGYFLFFILFSCGSSKKVTLSSPTIPWQDKPIVIDGDNDDWSLPYQYYDSKAKIAYSISNDKTNLYITLTTGDQVTQLKVLNSGMHVWLNVSSKKEKKTGITFPIDNPGPVKMDMQKQGTPQGSTISSTVKDIIDNRKDYALLGFVGCEGGYSTIQKTPCGIDPKMGISTKTNDLVWEAKIPFKSFYKESIDEMDSGKFLNIDFEINAMKRSSGSSEGGMRSGGNGVRGGRMRGSGGMRGGGGGGMRGGSQDLNDDRAKLYESTNTWQEIHLNYKK